MEDNRKDQDMQQQTISGYRVAKRRDEHIPYELHGPRGAHYGLMRNVKNPDMMFAVNLKRMGVVDRLGWFTDRSGKGSHRNVTKPITISGAPGDDAKHYQARAVRRAIEESKS